MIFTSLAFVALALVLLLVGVIKGSLGFAVASLVVAVVSGLLLLMANAVYRQMAAAQEGDADVDPAVRGGRVEAVSTGAVAAPAWGRTGPPVDGYADLTAEQAAKLTGTLSLEELHAMRRYEAEHANRKTVLTAVDGRIDTIVALRRELTTTDR